jgi:beta-glucosidase
MSVEEKIGQLAQPLAWESWERRNGTLEVSDKFKPVIGGHGVGILYAVLRADPWTKLTLETGLSPAEGAAAINALQHYAIENTRWGIPLLFTEECVHGFMALRSTVFPPGSFLASTWNDKLLEKVARVVGAEARSEGVTIGLGPILDLAREPRWSRVEESFGEDPWLASQLGLAMVRGFQTPGADGRGFASTLKHFAAHGEPEGGHNSAPAHVGPRELHEVLLSAFRRAVKEGGALAIMGSYNEIDGVPCSSSRYFLTDLPRGEWGFKGIVMSDCGSVEMLLSHGVAADLQEASGKSFHAGLDSVMTFPQHFASLQMLEALDSGKLQLADVDECVRHVLQLKFRLGIFEHPYVQSAPTEIVGCQAHRELCRQVTREGITLLTNRDGFLPLSRSVKTIAVIGPNADRPANQFGHYVCPQPRDSVWTVLDGIRSLAGPDCQVRYARGCSIQGAAREEFPEALAAARGADVAVVVVGGSSARRYDAAHADTGASVISKDAEVELECGEGMDRSELGLPGVQEELLRELEATGTPLVVIYIAGRPLNMNWAAEHARALLMAWYPGSEGGRALAEVLFGDYNPAGRLPVSVPRSANQLPVYYNHKPTARKDYVFEPGTPLFGFGYGLSYTTFRYEALDVTPGIMAPDGVAVVSVSITNTGTRDGDEVVQLYVRDLQASTTRPVRELKGFQRVHLRAGESRRVSLDLRASDLAILNESMQWVVEPGRFKLAIGGSQKEILTTFLDVAAPPRP